VFFENTHCGVCGRLLGYDPEVRAMVALESAGGHIWRPADAASAGRRYRLCRNTVEYAACNWLVPADSSHAYCVSCGLNRTIPYLGIPDNLRRWRALETAKRRLIYTLLELSLPVISRQQDPEGGLAFAFVEDRASNPNVPDEHVLTGHSNGLITINVREADAAALESARQQMNEPYRTLLGHFRHETGHYYWDRFISATPWLAEFRQRFGDERQSYPDALQRHYAQGPPADWPDNYLAAYAASHPWEDWAETWAHYLHMTDTLETALSFGLVAQEQGDAGFDHWLSEWMRLTVVMNALNRSMGIQDAYPFVLSPAVIGKLRFVHQVITSPPNANPASAVRGMPV
jgi:hypothetical protein